MRSTFDRYLQITKERFVLTNIELPEEKKSFVVIEKTSDTKPDSQISFILISLNLITQEHSLKIGVQVEPVTRQQVNSLIEGKDVCHHSHHFSASVFHAFEQRMFRSSVLPSDSIKKECVYNIGYNLRTVLKTFVDSDVVQDIVEIFMMQEFRIQPEPKLKNERQTRDEWSFFGFRPEGSAEISRRDSSRESSRLFEPRAEKNVNPVLEKRLLASIQSFAQETVERLAKTSSNGELDRMYIKNPASDNYMLTPLMLTVKLDNFPAFKILIECGANPDTQTIFCFRENFSAHDLIDRLDRTHYQNYLRSRIDDNVASSDNSDATRPMLASSGSP